MIQGDDGRIEGKQLQVPGEGVLIHGLYLEGAKWDEEKGNLCEPVVMELYVPMPVIHFKPI